MTVPRRCVALTAAALTLLSLVACSKDSKGRSTASGLVSSRSSSSHTTLAGAGATASASSSPASAGPCTAPHPPVSAVNVTHAVGDFNGDGTTDSLTVYGTGSASQPSPYHIQIELADGHGTIDTVIADAATDNNQSVKALGGADVTASAGSPPDGSGDEAFVEVGSGVSDALVGVFQLTGCTLTRLTGPVGTGPSSFAVGGSVTHLDGLRCDGTAGGQRLVELSAASDDGVTYTTKETRLTVEAGHFSASASVDSTLSASDPQLQEFSALNCPGVQAA